MSLAKNMSGLKSDEPKSLLEQSGPVNEPNTIPPLVGDIPEEDFHTLLFVPNLWSKITVAVGEIPI